MIIDSIINNITYPKAILLISISCLNIGWLIYFIRRTLDDGWHLIKTLYYPYISYVFFVILWVLSNAYFHTGWLVSLGEPGAIVMGKAANIVAYMAYSSAYHFSCRLKSAKKDNKIKRWEVALITVITLYVLYVNLMTNNTISAASVSGPSDFILYFGSQTPLFFSILILFSSLCVINLLFLYHRGSQLKRLKATYMVIGIIVYMFSTILSQLFITFFFHDFSFTWIPPALSITELFIIGYAVICHRFYSWRYLVYRIGSALFTTIVYIIPFLVIQAYGYTVSHRWIVILYCIVSGLTWHKTWHYISQLISQWLYGDKQAPAEKIYALVEDFQTSSQQAMQKLTQLLQLETGQPTLISPQQGDALYTSYLKQRHSVLLLEELEYQFDNTQNEDMRMIQAHMSEHKTAIIIPIYDRDHTVSQLFISPHKHNGALYSHEEIFALQQLFKQVQRHIQNNLWLKQSQAMAKSIAHEMRNPLAQVQLHLEKLDQLLIKNQLSRIVQQIQQEIKSGQEAIHHGNQLIEMILQETTQSMVNVKLTPYFISGLIEHSIHAYAFNDSAFPTRIHFNPQNDFIIQVNKTLFAFIMFNLLKNAIYYFNDIPESRIEIYLESGKKYNLLHFKDYGPGIDPYVIQSIFDDFFTYQKSGGTGLGLSYCRRTMQLFGGDITCYSAYNRYTQFSLKFPHVDRAVLEDLGLPQATGPTSHALPEPISELGPFNLLTPRDQRNPNEAQPLLNINILVTDDQPIQLALVKRYLEPLGARIYTAQNGKLAVDIITQHPIDLVLMDIQMPVMNGFEACKLIKQTHSTLPVIALSGETDEETIAKMDQIMDERLVKPTTKPLLLQMIQRFVIQSKIDSL